MCLKQGKFSIVLAWILLVSIATAAPRSKKEDPIGAPRCGYDSCHPIKNGMLNVHIVAHTHDDVGWLKTVDQYYYGAENRIQKASVEDILDSTIDELLKDPNKRFIYVETAYFWKWWMRQHDSLRHKVKKLVNNGQLEFIGGAWSMNDEAVTNYQSIIDQFTWGLRKLNETFGDCGRPKVGWQIDPFGHSREMASIFAGLGFDGMLFGRLDYQDKDARLTTKTAEMVWRGSDSLGKQADLFTSVLFNNYQPPPGFCFDVLCQDTPIIDDKRSPEYNVDAKVKQISDYAQNQAKYYQTNNILLTMGGDFTYMDAHMWYKNLDKLIRYTNDLQKDGSNVNLLYSTPSCYLKAVHDERPDRQWPVKSDDFFPYASDPHSYWTGYYTSRPTIKRYERMGNNFLQICKQLYSLTDLGPEDWVDLSTMREAMGVMQHHDAITGTEKQHVANDYARILSEGFADCEIITSTALNKLMIKEPKQTPETPKLTLLTCPLANISQCEPTEASETFVVTLYNPLSRDVSQIVRLPVTGKGYKVYGPDEKELEVQLVPIPHPVKDIPGRASDADLELIFRATEIPALGFKSYYVEKTEENMITKGYIKHDHSLENDKLRLKVAEKTTSISKEDSPYQQLNIEHDFLFYESQSGDNSVYRNRSSGAYIFRPLGQDAIPVSKKPETKVFKGPIAEEMHIWFSDWVSQVVRVYKGESYMEFEWLVGPIPVDDGVGKEVISRFTTEMPTNGTFYTDSNGREMLKRVRDFRPTWNLKNQEPVSGNYYPVTSKILLKDNNGVELAVLTDRAQGGSSLRDGEIELMVHRRLLHDDAFGVAEPLNEKAFGKGLVARGQHYMVLGNTDEIKLVEKDIAQRKLLSAWTFISPVDIPYDDYKKQYKMEFSGVTRQLPENVQIMTLEPWKANTFLLRLEHIFEKGEHPSMSKPVVVDLQTLFSTFNIKQIQETTLGANQWLKDNKRLNWKLGKPLESYQGPDFDKLLYKHIETNEVPKESDHITDFYLRRSSEEVDIRTDKKLDPGSITMEPMQIRTFVVEIEKK